MLDPLTTTVKTNKKGVANFDLRILTGKNIILKKKGNLSIMYNRIQRQS